MGVVYLGYDPVIDRMVAIKTVIIPETLPDEARKSFVERFLQEARIAGKLLHPNIVVTYDAATDEKAQIPFIVMELIEGEPLSRRLRERTALHWKEALEVTIPLAQALEYAHEKGIIHRDIKPANVIVTLQGVPKLADFGIAKLPTTDHTQTGRIIGTPSFMSPEQLMKEPVDGRSDVFSLGVLLYRCVTGRLPFEGEDVPTIVSQVLYKNPQPLSELVPGIPEGLDSVLARALQKQAQRRYRNATAFSEDLLSVAGGTAPPLSPSIGESTIVEESEFPTKQLTRGSETRSPLPSRRRLLLGLALSTLVAVMALALIFGRDGSGPELPLELAVTHQHLVGECSGQLTFHAWGVEYTSQAHATWRWEWDEIGRMERTDNRHLSVVTREDGLRYYFTLTDFDMEDDLWAYYSALAQEPKEVRQP